MGPSPCNPECQSGHCTKEHCPIKEFWVSFDPLEEKETAVTDRLAIALKIEDLSRQLDVEMDKQRNLVAEVLLLCQQYLDSIEGNYER